MTSNITTTTSPLSPPVTNLSPPPAGQRSGGDDPMVTNLRFKGSPLNPVDALQRAITIPGVVVYQPPPRWSRNAASGYLAVFANEHDDRATGMYSMANIWLRSKWRWLLFVIMPTVFIYVVTALPGRSSNTGLVIWLGVSALIFFVTTTMCRRIVRRTRAVEILVDLRGLDRRVLTAPEIITPLLEHQAWGTAPTKRKAWTRPDATYSPQRAVQVLSTAHRIQALHAFGRHTKADTLHDQLVKAMKGNW